MPEVCQKHATRYLTPPHNPTLDTAIPVGATFSTGVRRHPDRSGCGSVCARCVPASLLLMADLPLGDPAFCSSLATVAGDVLWPVERL